MEETRLDLLMQSEPSISPMPPEAWLLLAVMLGLVAWYFWAEWRDLQRSELNSKKPQPEPGLIEE